MLRHFAVVTIAAMVLGLRELVWYVPFVLVPIAFVFAFANPAYPSGFSDPGTGTGTGDGGPFLCCGLN